MVYQFLLWVGALVTLAISAVVAQIPKRRWRGILLGVICGLAAGNAFLFGLAFLESVMPLAQLDFWLASRLRDVLPQAPQ